MLVSKMIMLAASQFPGVNIANMVENSNPMCLSKKLTYMTTYSMEFYGYNWNKMNSPYKELLNCIGCLATPPEMVDYVFQPVEESRLSFYFCSLEKMNKLKTNTFP